MQRLPSAVDIYLKTCLRSSCCESWMVSTHFNTMQQWKSNFTILNNQIINFRYFYIKKELVCNFYMKLGDVWSSAFGCCDLFDFHYLNGVSTGTMSSSHITIQLSNSASCSQISVLSVHVVCATSRVVTKPDCKIFNFCWFSVKDLNQLLKSLRKKKTK